jgi:hypothetical protein
MVLCQFRRQPTDRVCHGLGRSQRICWTQDYYITVNEPPRLFNIEKLKTILANIAEFFKDLFSCYIGLCIFCQVPLPPLRGQLDAVPSKAAIHFGTDNIWPLLGEAGFKPESAKWQSSVLTLNHLFLTTEPPTSSALLTHPPLFHSLSLLFSITYIATSSPTNSLLISL